MSEKKKESVVITGTIKPAGLNVRIGKFKDITYVSLSDLVSELDGQRYIIEEWIRNRAILDWLDEKEKELNIEYNHDGYDAYIETLSEGNIVTLKGWTKATNAMSIIIAPHKKGGVWAMADVSLKFASFICPVYKLLLMGELVELKDK